MKPTLNPKPFTLFWVIAGRGGGHQFRLCRLDVFGELVASYVGVSVHSTSSCDAVIC